MVCNMRIVLKLTIIHHLATKTDECDTQMWNIVRLNITVECLLRTIGKQTQIFLHVRVVVLQLQVESVHLKLLLSRLLKDDERHSKDKEDRKHTHVKLCSYGYSHKNWTLGIKNH